MVITKDTILADILAIPDAEKVLAKYKMPCLTCPMAQLEAGKLTIGQVAKMYGIDIDNLLKELNEKKQKNLS